MDNHIGDSDFPGNNVANISDINLSDVIAVIENNMIEEEINTMGMVNNNNITNDNQSNIRPTVEIIEQPAPKALRFRYECEGRSAGSIPGIRSTPDNKTFPTIQIKNYTGRAVVVVSCVTKDAPYKTHPHSIVGRDGCKKGVCTLEINSDDMKMVFSNLGIQCVKRRDIEEALKTREEIRVDPFRKGYGHRNQPSSIDLNAVRLCFQVFLEGAQRGRFTVPIDPVVSEPIFDKKSTSDLVITKVSHCNASCYGGQEVILLCEKVTKDDIKIIFYEESGDLWEAEADFTPSQVHKQVAITFKTPKYKNTEITEAVKVKMQLRRPTDDSRSEPVDFEMLPLNEDPNELKKRKRQLSCEDNSFVAIKKSPRQDGFTGFDHNVKQEARLSPAQQYHLYGLQPSADSNIIPSPQPNNNSPLHYDNFNNLNTGFDPNHQFQPQQQQHQYANILGNQNFQFTNPSYTPNLIGQPSTSNGGFAIPQSFNTQNLLNGIIMESSADIDYGLMNQPRATQVTNDQSMSISNMSALDLIMSLSGDLNKLSVSDLNLT